MPLFAIFFAYAINTIYERSGIPVYVKNTSKVDIIIPSPFWYVGISALNIYFSASSCISIGLHPEHPVTPFVSMLSIEAPSTARPAPAMTSSSRCAQIPDRLIEGPEAGPQKADQESTASGKNRIPLSSIRIRTCSGIRARSTMSTSNGDDCTISMAR